MKRIRLGLVAAALLTLVSHPLFAQLDPELLAGMKARSIGPATMSGRIAAIDAVESNPNIVYAGAATGGLWKSSNGGLTWDSIFDDQPVHAIGAIAVHQKNPDIVWVGTGEGNVRNSASVGNGVYKSVDAGKTWKPAGLEKSERISRIITHPTNPDVAWVAALGQAWGTNSERGVFKTMDGGRSWKKVLFSDEQTGAADLVIDPSNPDKLFAAMWQYRRWPWFFRSGGPSSGLHVTLDGGDTWKRLTEDDGLPKGDLGRIGIAVARSNPAIVYALIEAEKSALVRSDDGGKTWRTVNQEADIASRPFYYADIRVDPADPNRVYNVWSLVSLSTDGGKTFEVLIPFAKIHPDHHAFWIDPNDPRRIYDGNDGGVGVSHDRGRTWRYVANLPVAQYYHINADMEIPYNIYGGMQDNGSWRGPSTVWENGGIRNHHWQEVGFGDGFATLPDPEDSSRGYAMSQEGYLVRWNVKVGERKDIRPPAPDKTELRFNWNSAIAIDPFDSETVYYGSQFVHKSTDRGDSWTLASPDLTTNNPDWQHQKKSGGVTPDVTGAENFTTIMTIAPSPVERGVIWAGTDDGRVHLTRDGTASWTSVEGAIKGVPKNSWVPHIEPSKYSASTAFVVLENHRRSDWTPYVYKTTDFGKSWSSLATPELRGYALVIEQDPIKEDLLFLGTEFGLFVSLDGGRKWMQWKHGVPTASTMALMIHPRDHDLIIATHGRSAYIFDDIRPLRSLSSSTMAKPIHLFEIPDAQQYRVRQTGGTRFAGDGEFRGQNRPYGALITYSLNVSGLPHPKDENERERREAERGEKRKKLTSAGVPQEFTDIPKEPSEEAMAELEKTKEDEKPPKAQIEIRDASGALIRSFRGPANQGVNRASWNLRRDAFKQPPQDEPPDEDDDPSGPEIVPGTYSVKIKYKESEASGTVRVLHDPRIPYDSAARAVKWAAIQRTGDLQEVIVEAIERIEKARGDIDTIVKRAKPAKKEDKTPESTDSKKNAESPLTKMAADLKKQLDRLERRLWIPTKTKGIVAETDALSKVSFVQFSLPSSYDAPTSSQLTYLRQAEEATQSALDEVNRFFATEIAKFREEARKSPVELLQPVEPLQVKKPKT